MLMIKSAYYELSLSFTTESLLAKQMKLLEGMEKIASGRYAVDSSAQNEVLEVKSRKALLLLKFEEEEEKITSKNAELNHLMGREIHDNTWRPQELSPSNTKENFLSKEDFPDLIASNPKIKALEYSEQAQKSKVEYAKLGSHPDFNLGIGYMQRFSYGDNDRSDFLTAKISFNLPFWKSSKQDEEIRVAASMAEQQKNLLKETKAELAHKIHEAYAGLIETENKIKLYSKELIPLNKAAIETEIKSYETNKSSILNVLNLMASSFETENSYYEALADKRKILAQIDALKGESML